MPCQFLEKHTDVTLLTVGPSHTVDQHPDGGIMALFARHDVKAEHIHDRGVGRSVAETIVQTADELGSDLIIMGAYEHSKFSQDLFGGVTTEMLKKRSCTGVHGLTEQNIAVLTMASAPNGPMLLLH